MNSPWNNSKKSAPSVQLTDAQKAQLAEIDSTYKARIAEKELFLKGKIARSTSDQGI